MASHRRGQPVKVELYTYRILLLTGVRPTRLISVVILNSCVAPIRLNQAQGGGNLIVHPGVHHTTSDVVRHKRRTRKTGRSRGSKEVHACTSTCSHHHKQETTLGRYLSISERSVPCHLVRGARCALLRGFSPKSNVSSIIKVVLRIQGTQDVPAQLLPECRRL